MLERIAQRYEVEETLGKGGSAVVYQVLDTTTGRRVALKRLVFDGDDLKREELAKLFEYEFYTLAQLGHPRVIEVYDFGRDEDGPYYTMELLDGGDLRELSPLPWKKACSFIFDVCSALSLLHSRRQIHRDLSPRNIRCTRDAKAKLIDFGAMTPMGPSKKVIGTPPLTPPEVLSLQWLDARADLYSLGGTLYFGLTGRHAYPARNFAELTDLWRSKPRPPSTYAPDIPKELDDLVLALLSTDRMARPVNAAEVMEKLSAIAGLEVQDQLVVSQAYLSTPTLVGREEQVMRVRRSLARAHRGHGNVLLIEGESGIGRSRFLDACVLEGKLGGALVLKADAADGGRGNWGVARALATALLGSLPELAAESVKPYARILEQAFPGFLSVSSKDDALAFRPPSVPAVHEGAATSAKEPSGLGGSTATADGPRDYRSIKPSKVISSIPPEPFNNPQEIRPRVHAALRDWLIEISNQNCLMVVVDDIHRIDEPSAAFLALLAHEAPQMSLMLVVTVETGAPANSVTALKLIKQAGDSLKLRELSLEETQALLGSVFGEVSNVGLLGDRLFSVTRGNPRAIMQLTQYLVDKGSVRYQSGVWTLPRTVKSSDLPSGINEALRTRLRKLSAEALCLAQTLALDPEQGFSFEECLSLSEHGDTGKLIANLDELVAAEILTTDSRSYTLNQTRWVSELIGSLSDDRKRSLHIRLAETLQRRYPESLIVVQHLLSAGEVQRALEVFVGSNEATVQRIEQDPRAFSEYFQSLPKNWVEIYEMLFRVSKEVNRPRKDWFFLEYSFVGLSSVTWSTDKMHLTSVIDQLYRDSVLRFYQELGDSFAGPDRLARAMELAQQHYEQRPEWERCLEPIETVRYLAQAITFAVAFAGISYDYHMVTALPSLAPLITFSEALGIIDQNVRSTRYLYSGRLELAVKGYIEVLERIAEPDRGGIEEAYYEYTRLTVMFAIGVLEASLGVQSALKWVREFEDNPLFQLNGVRVQMVYYLRQGDTKKAEQCKKRLELLQIQNTPSQFFEGSHVYPEVLAYSAADDLNGVKQTIDGIQTMAARFPSWNPILFFARGEYQRIRGDYKKALSEFEEALNLAKLGEHILWPHLASCYINALYELERFEKAREVGRKFLADAQAADLGILCNFIVRSLALVEAKLGAFAEATEKADGAIEQYVNANIAGLNLGLAYETRARVAILMGDEQSFRAYAEKCAEQYKPGRNPALIAKYEKLIQEAQRAELSVPTEVIHAADLTELGTAMALTMVAGLLGDCRGPQERAQRVLEILVEQSQCDGGFLYTIQKDGPVLGAQNGADTVPAEMDELVRNFLSAELDDAEGVTKQVDFMQTPEEKTSDWNTQMRERYRPLVLGHRAKGGYYVTGVAVLIRARNRLFKVPTETASVLSRSLLESGDVTGILSSDGIIL